MRKHPEFESLPLRFLIFTWCCLIWQTALYVWRSTQVGRRGAPAKGVGRVTGARVQISPSPVTVCTMQTVKNAVVFTAFFCTIYRHKTYDNLMQHFVIYADIGTLFD